MTEHKQIERIADNVQTILDIEMKSRNKIQEKMQALEGKFSNLQNTLLSPESGVYIEDCHEKKAISDYIRKGTIPDIVTKSLSSSDDEGGAVIITELSRRIITDLNSKSVFRQLANSVNISTSSLDLVLEDGKWGFGWVDETEARAETEAGKLLKISIPTHELYAQPKVTQRLLEDAAIDVESWVVDKIVDIFRKVEEEAFINGNGEKKPRGLLAHEHVAQIEIENEISTDSILDLIYALPEEYLNKASFLMNRKTLATIQNMKDFNDKMIFQQSASDSLKQTIFGIPVWCSPCMPEMTEESLFIALGDFKQAYTIVDRTDVRIIQDRYTEKPWVKFYTTKRVGGSVTNPAAVKFAKFTASEEDE